MIDLETQEDPPTYFDIYTGQLLCSFLATTLLICEHSSLLFPFYFPNEVDYNPFHTSITPNSFLLSLPCLYLLISSTLTSLFVSALAHGSTTAAMVLKTELTFSSLRLSRAKENPNKFLFGFNVQLENEPDVV